MWDYRGVPRRYPCFNFVTSFRWSSSGFRGGTESSQRMETGDGEVANWTVCRLLRNGGISRISRHSIRHCDRSALGSAGTSCRRIKSWAASLLVESDLVVARKGPGNVLHLRSRTANSELTGSRDHREGDAPGASCD